jgi:S1-C subfamily serine protease
MTSHTIFLIAIASFVFSSAAPARADDLTGSYATVRQSLALVVVPTSDKGVNLGTAFCIASDSAHSYFLTNAHVVGSANDVGVLFEGEAQPLVSHVVRTNTALDAAVIDVPRGNVPALQLSETLPVEGGDIAVAGYPASQIDLAKLGLGLTPSVHRGVVSALPMRGLFIEYDAHSEHGNSGSPVFDPTSGVVYGLQRLGYGDTGAVNVAITASSLDIFLQNAHVVRASSQGSSPAQSIGLSNSRSGCLRAFNEMQGAIASWKQSFGSAMTDYSATRAKIDLRDANADFAQAGKFNIVKGDLTYIASFIEPSLFSARDDLRAAGDSETTRYGANLVTMILALDYSFGRISDEQVAFFENVGAHKPFAPFDNVSGNQAIEAMQAVILAVRNPVSRPCEQ